MWRLLFTFLALALGSAVVGCEVKQCTAMGCGYTILISVSDEQGEPVERFDGTAVIEGMTYSFECSNDSASSRVSGGDGFGFAMCSSGSITLPFAAGSEPIIELSITSDDDLSFEGEVTPIYLVNENFNGKGCGTCTSGQAAVTLQ